MAAATAGVHRDGLARPPIYLRTEVNNRSAPTQKSLLLNPKRERRASRYPRVGG